MCIFHTTYYKTLLFVSNNLVTVYSKMLRYADTSFFVNAVFSSLNEDDTCVLALQFLSYWLTKYKIGLRTDSLFKESIDFQYFPSVIL